MHLPVTRHAQLFVALSQLVLVGRLPQLESPVEDRVCSHMAVATDRQRFHDFSRDDVECQSHILADVEASVPTDHRDPESSIAIGERRDLSLE